jgi:hypothetical protein
MGKGRTYIDYGIRDFYKSYSQQMKESNSRCVSRSEFSNFFKQLTEAIRDRLLDAEEVVLPYKLGTFQIAKFERTFKKPTAVNWELTKQLGTKIYHEDPYTYKLYWDKTECIVKNKIHYTFKPCRTLERLSAKKIKQENRDYYFKSK